LNPSQCPIKEFIYIYKISEQRRLQKNIDMLKNDFLFLDNQTLSLPYTNQFACLKFMVSDNFFKEKVKSWSHKETKQMPNTNDAKLMQQPPQKTLKPFKKMPFHFKERKTTFLHRVKDIDWTKIRPGRAGVIIYTDNPNRKFCMGIDREYGEITDFGGGVSYKKDGNALEGALRELNEESLGVFGEIPLDSLSKSIVVYNDSILIVFIKVPTLHIDSIMKAFNEKVHFKSEVSSLIMMSEREFRDLIQSRLTHKGKMYSRVRVLLNQVPDLLKSL